MPAMTYLIRPTGSKNYHFRRGVPDALRAAVGSLKGKPGPITEIKESLRTPDLAEAKRRAHRKALEIDALFKQAAGMSQVEVRAELSDLEISKLADLWKHDVLEEDEEVRRDGDGSDAVYAAVKAQLVAEGAEATHHHPDEIALPHGLSNRVFAKQGEALAIVTPAHREALARGRTELVEFEVEDLLERNGLRVSNDSPSFRKLAFAVLKAQVEVDGLIAQRQAGEAIDTPPAPVISRTVPVAAARSSDTLQAAYDDWKDKKQPPKKTALEFATAVRRFSELHGAVRIGSITRQMVIAFRDEVARLLAAPTHEQRAMPLAQQVEDATRYPDKPRLAPASVAKQVGAIKAVLQLACDDHRIPSNPAQGVKIHKPNRTKIARRSYNQDDLSAIAAFPIYRERDRPIGGKGEAAFWLPILCLYTGARQTEMGQLLVTDVREEGGVRFFDIRAREGDEVDQEVKTLGSNRRVPVHPEIIRLGFLDYLEARKAAGGAMLFPDLKARESTNQLLASWSQWWGRYAREHGVPDRDKSFHSFRHTFKAACRRAAIDVEIHDALTGHAGGGSGRGYGRDGSGAGADVEPFPLTVLTAALEKISYWDVAFPRWST